MRRLLDMVRAEDVCALREHKAYYQRVCLKNRETKHNSISFP